MPVIDFRDPRKAQNPYSGEQNTQSDRRQKENYAFDEDASAMDSDEQVRQKRREHLLRVLRILGIGVFLVAVILLIMWQSANRVFSRANYIKVADMISREDTQYLPLGDNVVSCSRDGASCMDINGNKVWSVTFEMQKPVISVSGDVMAVGDYNGSEIHIMNSREELGRINTNLPIRSLTVSESGEVAAVLDDTEVTWVYLFNVNGEPIAYFKTTMGQSGYPIGVAVSPNGELVCVSHMTIASSTVNTSIAFYNFGAVGQNSVENNVSGFNYDDEMFPFVCYMNDTTAVAVSDSRIAFFKGGEIPKNSVNAIFRDTISGIYTSDRYIGLLFPDTSGKGAHNLKVYNTDGTEVGNIRFSLDYSDITICGERVIINNDHQCEIYGIDGKKKYEGDFRDTVHALIPGRSSSSRYMIITDTTVEQMVLE